jgi:hypothetical protein
MSFVHQKEVLVAKYNGEQANLWTHAEAQFI